MANCLFVLFAFVLSVLRFTASNYLPLVTYNLSLNTDMNQSNYIYII